MAAITARQVGGWEEDPLPAASGHLLAGDRDTHGAVADVVSGGHEPAQQHHFVFMGSGQASHLRATGCSIPGLGGGR